MPTFTTQAGYMDYTPRADTNPLIHTVITDDPVEGKIYSWDGEAIRAFAEAHAKWTPPHLTETELACRTNTALASRMEWKIERGIRPVAYWWHGRHHDDIRIDDFLDDRPLRKCAKCGKTCEHGGYDYCPDAEHPR